MVREDERRDYGERRLVALGASGDQGLRVVSTLRDGDIRIISAWKARRDEREIYAKARGDRPLWQPGRHAAAKPFSPAFDALTDEEVEARAAEDPDAGFIPPGFWDTAKPLDLATKVQITLRLDADVLRHFRGTGKGYQSRINAVLKSYVRAKERAG